MPQASSPRTTYSQPIPLTSYAGREQELAVVRQLTRIRLLPLTGPAGSGKIPLAPEAADDLTTFFQDGVRWLELAPLSDPALVPQAVASAPGTRERRGTPLIETITDYLRPRQLLSVLDNCEHLSFSCAQLCELLLGGCPQLHMLATSREVLNIAGETPGACRPLCSGQANLQALVAGGELVRVLQQCEAVQLFVERAGAVLPSSSITQQTADKWRCYIVGSTVFPWTSN